MSPDDPPSECKTDPAPPQPGEILDPLAPIDFDIVYDEVCAARERIRALAGKLMRLRKELATTSLSLLQEVAQLQIEAGELERLLRRIERRTEPRELPDAEP